MIITETTKNLSSQECLASLVDVFWIIYVLFPISFPDLSFAWVFNEYPYFVQQDNRRFVSQETGNLYIAKVEPSDVGNYTCVVVNRITKGKVLSSPTPLVLRTDGKYSLFFPVGNLVGRNWIIA